MSTSSVSLEHALLGVHDLEATLRFYRRLFPDWTVRWQGQTRDGAPWAHFGPPGEGRPGYLSLPQKPDAGPAAAAGRSPAGMRIEHVGFAHPDVGALVSRLQAAGVVPSDRAEDDRFRRVYFVDPNGHELEFVQEIGS